VERPGIHSLGNDIGPTDAPLDPIMCAGGFDALGRRDAVARIDGGGLPLREAARVTGIVARIEPTVDELVAQRIFALALGHEDLNNPDDLRHDPLYGHQAVRFVDGYYMNYCYLPLHIFCGELLLCARLRPSNIDASTGSIKELERIIGGRTR